MASRKFFAWGPFGTQVRVQVDKSGQFHQVVCVRPSTTSLKETQCSCPRCMWKTLPSKQQNIHHEGMVCFCPDCEHQRGIVGNPDRKVSQCLLTKQGYHPGMMHDYDVEEIKKSPSKEKINQKKDKEVKPEVKLEDITEEQIKQLIEMKMNGEKHNTIANKLGIDKKSVSKLWELLPEDRKIPEPKEVENKDEEKSKTEDKKSKSETKSKPETKSRKLRKAKPEKSKGEIVKVDVKIPSPDKNFSEKDIEIVEGTIRSAEEDIWKKVAKQFYTQTNKSFNPEDFKYKFCGQVG